MVIAMNMGATCIGQELTWATGMTGSIFDHVFLRPSPSQDPIAVYNHIDTTYIRICDWQGSCGTQTQVGWTYDMLPVNNGHLVAGRVKANNLSVGGLPLVLGSATTDIYLAKFDSTEQIEWVTQTITLAGQNPIFSALAVNDIGESALLFRAPASNTIGTDTMHGLSEGDHHLIYFDTDGEVKWSTSIRTGPGYYGFETFRADMAIASDGSVWIAAICFRDFWVGSDTIRPYWESGENQVILRFDTSGMLTGHFQVPGPPDYSTGIFNKALLTIDNGNVVWSGAYNDSTIINADTLFTLGEADGLLLLFDPSLNMLQQWRCASVGPDQASGLGLDPLTGEVLVGIDGGSQLTFNNQTVTGPYFRTMFLASMNVYSGVVSSLIVLGGTPNSTPNNGILLERILATAGPIFLSGTFAGNVYFENGVATPSGDHFMARIDRDGSVNVPSFIGDVKFLRCWPSPTSDRLFVELPIRISETVLVHLISSTGVSVRQEVISAGTPIWKASVGDLPPGVYFIRINGDQLNSWTSFVKE